jgi:hypothetical protein
MMLDRPSEVFEDRVGFDGARGTCQRVAQSPEAALSLPSRSDHTERRLPTTSSGGLSTSRLDRIHNVMAGYVERREFPVSLRSSVDGARCMSMPSAKKDR